MPDFIPYARHEVTEDDIRAVEHVLRHEPLARGPAIERFEEALCEAAGAHYAVAVSSGCVALLLAESAVLESLPRSGGTIAQSPLTFVGAAAVAVAFRWGDGVAWIDVEPETLCTDLEQCPKRTALAVVTDYAGFPAPTYGRWPFAIIRDAAHSLGMPGLADGVDAACLSFHPAKAVCAGEGGAVITNREDIARAVRMKRDSGRTRGKAVHPSVNFWMDSMSAALGLSQLRRLDANIARRQEIAAHYYAAFSQNLSVEYEAEMSAWHIFPLWVSDPDRLRTRLADQGIGTQVHYPLANTHPALRHSAPPNTLGVADEAASCVVSVPMSHTLTDAEVERVIEAVKQAAEEVLP